MGTGTLGRTPASTPCPQLDGDPQEAGRVSGGDGWGQEPQAGDPPAPLTPSPTGDHRDAGRVSSGNSTPCYQPDGDPKDAGRVSGGDGWGQEL